MKEVKSRTDTHTKIFQGSRSREKMFVQTHFLKSPIRLYDDDFLGRGPSCERGDKATLLSGCNPRVAVVAEGQTCHTDPPDCCSCSSSASLSIYVIRHSKSKKNGNDRQFVLPPHFHWAHLHPSLPLRSYPTFFHLERSRTN